MVSLAGHGSHTCLLDVCHISLGCLGEHEELPTFVGIAAMRQIVPMKGREGQVKSTLWARMGTQLAELEAAKAHTMEGDFYVGSNTCVTSISKKYRLLTTRP